MAYKKEKHYTIYNASCLDVMDSMEENSIDCIITDPPYHLQSIVKRFGKEGSAEASTKNNDGSFARLSKGFMGKEWDGGDIAFRTDTWKKALRVLKPGGYLLAFNHSRTFHRMAVAIEDAGFEIRDTIMWLYGSGFPKSHDVSKGIDKSLGCEREVVGKRKGSGSTGLNSAGNQQFVARNENEDGTLNITTPSSPQAIKWQGWGSALKPAYEPIIMARKPIENTIAQNVLKYGVGGINIDECRVEAEEGLAKNWQRNQSQSAKEGRNAMQGGLDTIDLREYTPNGRFPANVIHDGSDEVVSGFPSEAGGGLRKPEYNKKTEFTNTYTPKQSQYSSENTYADSGSASRFFYTAKASKKDRDEGLLSEYATVNDGRKKSIDNPFQRGETPKRNIHPTVKPTDLMQYLVRLVAPKGSKVLDIFMGSGSTGKAVMIENNERNAGYHFIGIDLEKEYCDIAIARIEYGINYKENKAKEEEKEIVVDGQTSIFDF